MTTQDGAVYVVDNAPSSSLRSIPNGAVAVLLRPFPWEVSSSIALRFAAFENVGWYVLYVLAAVGAVASRRRRLLAFPIIVTSAILGIAFVTQGNVGTAFRHRGQVLPTLAVLAAVGAEVLHERWRGQASTREA